jgi:hypothetical protein
MAIPVGKRFEDKTSGIQLLVLKGNPAEEWKLMVDGREMELAGAKPLPSSD